MASHVVNGLLVAERPLREDELAILDGASSWTLQTLAPRYSFIVGPLAAFSRGLDTEELYTLAHMQKNVWAIDMDLLPARGTVELTTTETAPYRLSAPKLARRHEHNMRRDRG